MSLAQVMDFMQLTRSLPQVMGCHPGIPKRPRSGLQFPVEPTDEENGLHAVTAANVFSRGNSVFVKDGDCHWSDPAGHGGDQPSRGECFIEDDIADGTVCITSIDHRGTRFDPVSPNNPGMSVALMSMSARLTTPGKSLVNEWQFVTVALLASSADGFTETGKSSEDNGVLPRRFHAIFVEKPHDSGWCAGREGRHSECYLCK